MKKMIALLGTVTALALSVPANAAIISVISFPPGTFFIAGGNSASFGAPAVSGMFDDIFTFTTSQTDSSSLSVTTSGGNVTFSSILFNTMSLPGAVSGTGVAGPALTAGMLDTVEIKGSVAPGVMGPFSGTVTVSPVPEPVTWASFLLGFGFLGLGLRRRNAKNFAAA